MTESDEEIYYPILDRIHESLHEKYTEGLYKKKTESPFTVTFGNDLNQYGEMLASSLIVSMYNGSLTHILLIHEKIRDFVFYLCCKYDDWNFRLNLYKLAVFAGNEKEIKGLQNSYPEILNKLTSDEAASIMSFCLNHSIKYKRLNSQLLALGAVGYFLDDKCFEHYEKTIIGEINTWLNSENPVVFIGQNIFTCLSGVAYRISQNTLILFLLSRNSENYGVINHQLVTLIDSNGVHIKNLIMKHLHIIDGITDKTKEYIVSKCKHDANFVVRMVCAEEEQKRMSKE